MITLITFDPFDHFENYRSFKNLEALQFCRNFVLVLSFLVVVPLNLKIDRGSTGSGLTTAKRGKNQQAGKILETRTYNRSDGNLQL